MGTIFVKSDITRGVLSECHKSRHNSFRDPRACRTSVPLFPDKAQSKLSINRRQRQLYQSAADLATLTKINYCSIMTEHLSDAIDRRLTEPFGLSRVISDCIFHRLKLLCIVFGWCPQYGGKANIFVVRKLKTILLFE